MASSHFFGELPHVHYNTRIIDGKDESIAVSNHVVDGIMVELKFLVSSGVSRSFFLTFVTRHEDSALQSARVGMTELSAYRFDISRRATKFVFLDERRL